MSDRWSRFTQDAYHALQGSARRAKMFGHQTVTPEHLLAAMIFLPMSSVGDLLFKSVDDAVKLHEELVASLQALKPPEKANFECGSLCLSRTMEQVLRDAVHEAKKSGDSYIGTRHLLIGILCQPQLAASRILDRHGVSIASAQAQTLLKEAPYEPRKSLRQAISISPVFGIIVLVTAMAALVTYYLPVYAPYAVFVFVTGGWITSVALHEFAHAAVAYWGGDHTVVEKGYLTLNPVKYVHRTLSIVLPILILIAGGIGLPGAAVYINTHLIRKKSAKALGSAAGPLSNAGMALLLSIPFLLHGPVAGWYEPFAFWAALSFLLWLQIVAVCLNLLPIPGIDGYGIIRPFLPRRCRRQLDSVATWGVFLLFGIFFYPNSMRDAFWSMVDQVTRVIYLYPELPRLGYDMFRFWE